MTVEEFLYWGAYACVEIHLHLDLDTLNGAGVCANPRYTIDAVNTVTDHEISVAGSELGPLMQMVVQYMHEATGTTDTIPVPS